MPRLTEAQRDNAIGHLEAGEPQSAVARHLNVSQSTIGRLWHRYQQRGTNQDPPTGKQESASAFQRLSARSGPPAIPQSVVNYSAQDRSRGQKATCRIVRHHPSLLPENGCHLDLSRAWAKSLMSRMRLVWRKGTKLEERMEVFLEDSDPDAALDVGADMRKIQHCFQKLKILVTERRSSPSSLRKGDQLSSPHLPDSTLDVESDSTPQMNKLKELLQQRDNEITILVNMLKKEKKRAQDAVTQLSASSNGHSLSQGSLGSSGTEPAEASGRLFSELQTRGSLAGDSPLHHTIGGEMSLGRQEAFEIFRRDHVDIITIEDNKALLKQRFAEAKALGEKVKLARVKVNELKAQIEQRRMQRAAHGVISSTVDLAEPDPVEEELRVHIEEEKKSYKATFGRLKGLKTEIEHLQLLLERAKVKLQRDFEVWWSEEAARLQPQEERSGRGASENAWRTPAVSNTKSQKSNHKTRAPGMLVSPIPLTGDQQTDADILAFVQARQSLLQRKGNNPDIIYPFWYSQVVAVWIFFGLAWLSLVINLCIEMLEKLSTYLKQRQLDSLENKTIEETVEEPDPAEPREETSA
ncbi:Kinesin-like protein KIF6 [Acipenser ruthenus]|uniref:Kinesin-like protein KIF6 n=1 Tax=Acipenser ruthenus TaxID=7906 RepID=A0A444U5C6_ACIRT|nr:Kinesin-like protein KIF6 [Acipenser ruthenus]